MMMYDLHQTCVAARGAVIKAVSTKFKLLAILKHYFSSDIIPSSIPAGDELVRLRQQQIIFPEILLFAFEILVL